MSTRSTALTLAAVVAVSLVGTAPTLAADEPTQATDEPTRATALLDLSGLAPLGPGLPLGVHDGKSPDENDRPRASVLRLSDSPMGVTWQPVSFDWPAEMGEASDLESASSVPGTSMVLFAESGDDASDFQRLFLAEIDVDAEGGPAGTIVAMTTWPEPVFNVESIAVGQVGDDYVLLFAERAEGDPTTAIQSAPLTLDPFTIGEATGVDFTSPAVLTDDDRPVSAMDISSTGFIHIASAYDSGDDNGPFSSSVWTIGLLVEGDDGPTVELMPDPAIVTFADGIKIESLATIIDADGAEALYFGTDDENYGGILRPLPQQ
jgi:hypothetical protein